MHGAHRRCWWLEAGLGTEEEKRIPNIEVWEQAQEGWGAPGGTSFRTSLEMGRRSSCSS